MKSSVPIHAGLRLAGLLLALLGALLAAPVPAAAGEWQVIPIRLELDRTTRSGVLTVSNTGDDPLTVSVEALAWRQDEQGEDVYEPTSDLVFFPKSLTIAPGKERVIRTGIKVPAVDTEKTYRLFIEEKPDTRQPSGTGVALAIRFGVPIFVRPLEEQVAGDLGPLELQAGTLRIPVRNAGNVHFRINSFRVSGRNAAGEIVFEQELQGWYLLPGAVRTYTAAVPADACGELAGLEVAVTADGVELNGMTHVDQAMCRSAD